MNTDTTETKKRTAKRVKVKQDNGLKAISNHESEGLLDSTKPKPKKEKKEVTPQEWLASYTKEKEMTTSSAKLATHLLCNEKGIHLEELVKRCQELSAMKGKTWGSKSHLRSHFNFLKQKKLTVTEVSKDVYRLSA